MLRIGSLGRTIILTGFLLLNSGLLHAAERVVGLDLESPSRLLEPAAAFLVGLTLLGAGAVVRRNTRRD